MICRSCKKTKGESQFRFYRVKCGTSYQTYFAKTCRDCQNAATRRKRATETGKPPVDRECRVCLKTKKIDEFRMNKVQARKDGTKVKLFMWICKECECSGQRQKRAAQSYDYYTGTFLTQLLSSKWSSGQSLEG